MTENELAKIRDVPTLEGKVSPEEWQVRVDLATCYRLVRKNDWCNSIYNHCSARVPGEPDFMLMKGHPLLWDEVTASNLVKVNIHDELDESAGVNRPGFVLHSGLMRGRPEINAAVHIHEEASTAIPATAQGLLPLTQDGVFLYDQIAYHDYQGITENANERDSVLADMGDKPVMLMRSHGSVTVAANVREAYVLTTHLVKAAQIQLQLMAGGAELIQPSEDVCRTTVEQHIAHGLGRGQADWPAYQRELDRTDESYRH
ncbi:MAG: class II aldolase/adducin family protein [Rhodospirillales bacterium]|nr:class II aldolase/adducin family protein [Rhodospirillales bacterium]